LALTKNALVGFLVNFLMCGNTQGLAECPDQQETGGDSVHALD
jgi:hypothetical protein